MPDTLNARPLTLLPLEESLQAALDIANTGAWGWDQAAGEKLWPTQTKALFGLPPDAKMTKELFVSLLHPDDVPRYREAWAAAIDPEGNQIYELTYRIRRASDEAERWIIQRRALSSRVKVQCASRARCATSPKSRQPLPTS